MIAMKIKIIIAACVATLLLPSCGTFKTLVESAVVVGGEHLLKNYGDNSTQQIIDNYRTWAEEWNDSHPDSLGIYDFPYACDIRRARRFGRKYCLRRAVD